MVDLPPIGDENQGQQPLQPQGVPGFGRLTGPSRARRIAVIEELDRRGALPPRKKAVLDELRRRRAWPPPLQTGPQQSIPQQIMGAVGSTARGAVEAVTGEGRRSEDLPELQSMLRQEGRRLITDQRPGEPPTLASPDLITNQRLMGAVDIPASTQGKIAAIQRADPTAQFDVDRFGNVIVTVGGGRAFLNAPGLSEQDFREVGVDLLTEAPLIATGVGIGGRLASGIGGAAGAGTGAAGGSALRNLLGGEPVDLPRALLAGGLGAAGEVVAPFIGNVIRRLALRFGHSHEWVRQRYAAAVEELTDSLNAVR